MKFKTFKHINMSTECQENVRDTAFLMHSGEVNPHWINLLNLYQMTKIGGIGDRDLKNQTSLRTLFKLNMLNGQKEVQLRITKTCFMYFVFYCDK